MGGRLEKSLRHLRTRLSKSRAVIQCSCKRPVSVLVGLNASWLPNCHAAVCPSAGISFPGGKCVWAALGEHQNKAAGRRGGHCAYRRVFVCREAHVKCKSRQSCLTSEEETWTFFCPRRLCSKDCTRTDYSCVRFPPTSHLARKAARGVGWLPAKVKGCVDGVVILKTWFFFSRIRVFFIYFANIFGAKQAFLWWFQSSRSIFLSQLPLLAAQMHLFQMVLAGISKSFLQQNMDGEWKTGIHSERALNITNVLQQQVLKLTLWRLSYKNKINLTLSISP